MTDEPVDENEVHDETDEGDEGDEPIRGQVARILNLKDLVINRGGAHGVYVGMQFVILNRNAQNIVDPETDEVIGSVPVAKTIVKVVNVQDQMSIARTFRETRSTSLVATMAIFSDTPRAETLKTQESTAVQELDEKDSFVKRGDEAVEVTDRDEYLLPPF